MGKSFAMLFPGQGSQKVGMLAAAAERFPVVVNTFAEASAVLGYDAWDLVQNGDQDSLNLTERTQPLLLTASVGLWRAWLQAGGPKPSRMAGHSLGEFSALVCAGAIEFSAAVSLVRQRGRYMQSAVPVGVGAMAAVIGLDDEAIRAACIDAAGDEVVEAVNFNSPGQVVIAGHAAAVERAGALCRERGAKRAMPLPVSAPFHTSLMKPAGERLAEDIASIEIRSPEIPVLHNVHAEAESDPVRIGELLVEQIRSPVQWVATIQSLAADGINQAGECGPGKVLSGLCKRIDRNISGFGIEEPEQLESAIAALSAT